MIPHPFAEHTLSRTQLLDYLGCGYRWDLNYRRGIKFAGVSSRMDLGSANHMGIQYAVRAYVKHGAKKGLDKVLNIAVMDGAEAWAKEERKLRGAYLSSEMKDELRALQLEAAGIAKQGVGLIELPEWEVALWNGKPICEVEVSIPFSPWKAIRTKPDLVARRRKEKDSGFWFIDWKTRASFDDDEAEDINLQFDTMHYITERAIPKLPLEGSILWQIKSQAPHPPTMNKDGKNMSRAAIVCDWPLYEKTLKANKLDPAEYQDMKIKLEQIQWFKALTQHRSSEEVEAVWRSIVIPTAERMANDPQVIRQWNMVPFKCKGCAMKKFCITELYDGDTDFLLQTDYVDTRRPRKRLKLGDGPKRTFKLKE